MVSRNGFIEVFWNRTHNDFVNGIKRSRMEVYYDMEDQYEAEYNTNQFPSFDAFRKYLERYITKQRRD